MERWLAKLLRGTLVITQAGGPAEHNRGRGTVSQLVIQCARQHAQQADTRRDVSQHPVAQLTVELRPDRLLEHLAVLPAGSPAMARAKLLCALCSVVLFAAAVSAKGPKVTNKVRDPAIVALMLCRRRPSIVLTYLTQECSAPLDINLPWADAAVPFRSLCGLLCPIAYQPQRGLFAWCLCPACCASPANLPA